MDTRHWIQIESVIDEALKLPKEQQRPYIKACCRNDTFLFEEIIELMDAINASEKTHFLQKASKENKELVSELTAEKSTSVFIGRRIGAFKITEKIGAGGMGSVFKAARVDGEFKRKVAIKLVPKGFHSETTLKRFKVEKQILAKLSHPNIARLYDGGVTDDDHPYLIMEYIDGMPIDAYCDKHRLTVTERLDLFKEVCEAVQFAHQNLVIHRDLKSKNIYVNKDGTIKVLDFGIAKLLDPKMSDEELFETQAGYQFWTPYYAAPEQVMGEQVTTATDVYSLGILLHRLLTGTYPYDFDGKSMSEIRSIITQKAPKSLTQSLSKKQASQAAHQRSTSAPKLRSRLSGDLEAIVIKTLRQKPEDRYSSVVQLAGDITKHLHNQPITIRNKHLFYRLTKFGGRHKAGIAVSFIIILLIGGLTFFYLHQLQQKQERAALEADKARQVENLITDIFKQSSPFNQPNPKITLKEVLDRGSEKIVGELHNKPLVKAELSGLLGQIYTNLGLYDKGKPLLVNAISLQDAAKRKEPKLYIKNKRRLAYLLFRQEKYEEAEKLFEQAIKEAKKYYPPHSSKLILLYHDTGYLYDEMGKRAKAKKLYKKAMRLIQPNQKLLKATILNDQGLIYQKRDHFQKAVKLIQKSIYLRLSVSDTLSPDLANAYNDLAYTYQRYGKLEKADSLHQIALAMREKIFGHNHPHIASSLIRYGLLKIQEGKIKQADPMLQRGYEILKMHLPPDHWQVLSAKGGLALCRGLEGKGKNNLRTLQNVDSKFAERFGKKDWRTREAHKAYQTLLDYSSVSNKR